jgi:hypothetical protein
MRTFRITLSEEEHAFVKTKGNGFMRGLVQRAMERGTEGTPEPVATGTPTSARLGNAVGAVPPSTCPECGTPYAKFRMLGAVCQNEKCARYKEKP